VWLLSLPPASGALVMGTGVVSIAFYLDREEALAVPLLALAALVWLVLAVGMLARAARAPWRVAADARAASSLTWVAASAVLGTAVTERGWSAAGIALLAIASLTWVVLLRPVLTHVSAPTSGETLMLTVSTQSLAVLAAVLAAREHTDWLLGIALAALALGILGYCAVIARFDPRQLAAARGEQWVAGGALAISALAAARIALSARELHALGGASGGLDTVSLALWAAGLAWLPALVAGEALWRRPGYDLRRWSTVFPVGMYAAASFLVARAAGVGTIVGLARVAVWIALAVWLAVALAMARRALSH
jgi:hypothetical protein